MALEDHRPQAGNRISRAPQSGGALPTRRIEDANILLFAGDRSKGARTADTPTFTPTPEQLANAAFLIDLAGHETLVVPAADAHLVPRGDGGAELQARATAMAQALRRERDRLRRRLQMADDLMAYAEALQQARTEPAVYHALREVAEPVVSSYTAVVFVATGESPDAMFQPLVDSSLGLPLAAMPAETATRFLEPQLVTRTEVEASPGGHLAPLGAVMAETGASQLLCSPVGADGLLVLIERRRDRVLGHEERDLLGALVRQAEGALRRLALERQLTSLTLSAPLADPPAHSQPEILPGDIPSASSS